MLLISPETISSSNTPHGPYIRSNLPIGQGLKISKIRKSTKPRIQAHHENGMAINVTKQPTTSSITICDGSCEFKCCCAHMMAGTLKNSTTNKAQTYTTGSADSAKTSGKVTIVATVPGAARNPRGPSVAMVIKKLFARIHHKHNTDTYHNIHISYIKYRERPLIIMNYYKINNTAIDCTVNKV